MSDDEVVASDVPPRYLFSSILEDRTSCWHTALWSGTDRNPDVSTKLLARSFAHLLVPLTHLLAPHCLHCLLTRSLPWESEWFKVSKRPGFVSQCVPLISFYLYFPNSERRMLISIISVAFLLSIVFVDLILLQYFFLFFFLPNESFFFRFA